MFFVNFKKANIAIASPSRKFASTLAISAMALSAFALFASPTFAHSRNKHSESPGPSHMTLDRSQTTLMSRGAGFTAPAASITGQVAVVSADTASIYAGREQYGRLLFTVDKGTNIVVTGQTDKYYAVAMSDGQTGFIAKTDAELQDLQVTATGASDAVQPGAPTATTQTQSVLIQGILQSAYNYLGVTPYVWGGNTINGIDCSGFVKAVYSENGIKLPRTAAEQAKIGYEVPLRDLSQWVPGDRMYFMCHHDYIDHTGMYIGNGYFIHSSIHHHGVDIDKVQSDFYWNHLVAVRRSSEVVSSITTAQAATSAPDYETNQE